MKEITFLAMVLDLLLPRFALLWKPCGHFLFPELSRDRCAFRCEYQLQLLVPLSHGQQHGSRVWLVILQTMALLHTVSDTLINQRQLYLPILVP